MGLMADIGMPVNLTFIGPAYSDNDLLRLAYTYEQATHHRLPPPRVPALKGETIHYNSATVRPPHRRESKVASALTLSARIDPRLNSAAGKLRLTVKPKSHRPTELRLTINGEEFALKANDSEWRAAISLARFCRYGSTAAQTLAIMVVAKDEHGNAAAVLEQIALPVTP
jgi:amidase